MSGGGGRGPTAVTATNHNTAALILFLVLAFRGRCGRLTAAITATALISASLVPERFSAPSRISVTSFVPQVMFFASTRVSVTHNVPVFAFLRWCGRLTAAAAVAVTAPARISDPFRMFFASACFSVTLAAAVALTAAARISGSFVPQGGRWGWATVTAAPLTSATLNMALFRRWCWRLAATLALRITVHVLVSLMRLFFASARCFVTRSILPKGRWLMAITLAFRTAVLAFVSLLGRI